MVVDLKIFEGVKTPFYYYDKRLLEATLAEIERCISGHPVKVLYAIKANTNPEILRIVAAHGFGADCVSGNEVDAAIEAGFPAKYIYYAGVGKTDEEIARAIDHNIGCFNIESIEEIEIIAGIAAMKNKTANVALRINPHIDAHTHHYITTGLAENKFGIDITLLEKAVAAVTAHPSLRLIGLHFHIGSQITTMEPYRILCERINAITKQLAHNGIECKFINVGGGLGIDYDRPDANPIADFKGFFDTILGNLDVEPGQIVCCELGRSIVAQCGSLISKVVLVKKGLEREFVIIDAGMSDLIRPALYEAHHKIENISAAPTAEMATYDVVGPVCESADVLGKDEILPTTQRGDLIAIRSAGAYGETMASRYNMRDLPGTLLR